MKHIAPPSRRMPASPKTASPGISNPPLEAAVWIFCEDQHTASVAAELAADRRLAIHQPTVKLGGIYAARTAFADAPTPALLVVESLLDAGAMLADLERLSEICDPGTKVIVIGHVNDVLLYRELMQRHISDYLVAPVRGLQLVEAITAALSGETVAPPGRVIAFVGAKGGSGSSTVCHNTAWMMSEALGADTIIADFDLAFGTLGLDFNQDAAQGMADALAAGSRLDVAMLEKLLSKCSDRLNLLTPPCSLGGDADIGAERAVQLIQLLGQAAASVALDLPCDWRPATRALIAEADQIVITAEPDLANLRNAKNLIDAARALRATDKPPVLVLNKLSMPRRPEITPRDFANAVDLEAAVLIDFDAQLFGSAANNGLMIGEVAAKGKHAELFRSLAGKLSGKPARSEARSGLIKPLIERFSRKLAM